MRFFTEEDMVRYATAQKHLCIASTNILKVGLPNMPEGFALPTKDEFRQQLMEKDCTGYNKIESEIFSSLCDMCYDSIISQYLKLQ